MIAVWLESLTRAAKTWWCEVLAVIAALVIGGVVGSAVTVAVIQKNRADQTVKAPQVCVAASTIVHQAAVAASASASAEEKVDHVQTHVAVAESAAVASIEAAPRPSCPDADIRPGLDAWRSGIDGMRRAAGAAQSGDDDSAEQP